MIITTIRSDNFGLEVIEEKRPVLLACPHRYFEFSEQIEVLKSVAKRYGEALKVCMLSEDFIRAFSEKFGIEGAPTFLILNAGEEINRMLGNADKETLIAFISQTLPFSRWPINY